MEAVWQAHQLEIRELVVALLGAWGMGYLVRTLVIAMGQRRFADLVNMMTIVVCVSLALMLVAECIESITTYFDPILRYVEMLERQKGGWKLWGP